MPAVPAIIMGGAALGSSLLGAKAAKDATRPAEIAANAQAGATREQLLQGRRLFGYGMPMLERSGNYYQTLLSGSRPAMQQLMQPEVGQITDIYRGAERSLDRGYLRGGAKDYAVGELARERAGRIASLVPSVRPMAAAATSNLGQVGVSHGVGATGTAGGLYGELTRNALNTGVAKEEIGSRAGQDVGAFIFKMLQSLPQSGAKKSTLPSTPIYGAGQPGIMLPAGVPSGGPFG